MKRKAKSSSARTPRSASKGVEVLPSESPGKSRPSLAATGDDGDDESGGIAYEDLDSELESAELDEETESPSPADESLPVVTQRWDESPVSEGHAVSPRDPLKRYMEEVKRYPLLSPEEEFTLAKKLRDQGDLNAAKTLVSANLRLVVKIAFEYQNIYSNLLDLIQEGNIGLMKAVSKFDPTKGARLGYYASWWIRSYILKYLLDNFRLVRIGTTQAQKKLFYHLMREKQKIEAQGLLAGPKLLAEKLEVREKDVIEMEQRLSGRGGEVSLDTPVDSSSESKTTFVDFLQDSRESPDDVIAREQLLKLLKGKLPQFSKQLSGKERRILDERLLAEEPKTLQEIADNYGLTRERARQIEVKVIQKLREFLKPSFGTLEEEGTD